MLIRCLILRSGGSFITLDDTEYHFAPIDSAPGSPHVALVLNKEHQARLLSITEAYLFHGMPDEEPAGPPAPATTADEEPFVLPERAEAAFERIIAAPAAATEEDARLTFAAMEGREAHHKAKTLSIVKKIIGTAAEKGLVEQESADAILKDLG